jgi:hypothetical protein
MLMACSYDDADFMFDKQFMTDAKDVYLDADVFVRMSTSRLPLTRWTRASTDEEFMNHLLNLFFTWDNTVERSIYRPVFEEDILSLDPSSADSDSGAFCSKFLINAILAVSCVCYCLPQHCRSFY